MARTKIETAEPEVANVAAVNELKVAVPTSFDEIVENIKDGFKSAGRICIRPFVDASVKNMGLEKYDMCLFPETKHKEQLAALEVNGVVKYITGLDEFAPEVQNIRNKEERDAIIKNIRSIVAYLERTLATNIVDPNDKDFWNKVTKFKPNNKEFWDSVYLECGNEPLYLEPDKDPNDLIKIVAIEAGGFDMVAKSYDDAVSRAVRPKFYLDREVQTMSHKTEGKKLKNRALAVLEKVSLNPMKMLYLCKILSTDSAQYKVNTPQDILYDVLNDYIEGLGVERNQGKAAERFIETEQIDMNTLKTKAMVKDAIFFNKIYLGANGMMYYHIGNTQVGRTVADVVLFMLNPMNSDVAGTFVDEMNDMWK